MARRSAKRTKTGRRQRASTRQSLAKSNDSAAAEKSENERLARELRESQEREAAAADVLRVISRSPGDLDAVFRAMLENATRLCEAKFGTLFRYDGEKVHRLAGVGTPASLTEFQRKRGPFVPGAGTNMFESVRTKQALTSDDEAAIPKPGVAATYGGARSTLYVPLLKNDQVVGIFVIYRQEVRPFTDKQIELVQNFAAQAVIAIENTRLLSELRESLQQQTATADVLKVISSSPGDLHLVFKTMLAKATAICEASYGTMWLREGDGFRTGAIHGDLPAQFIEQWQREPIYRPGPDVPLSRAVATRGPAQVADLKESESYRRGDLLPTTGVNIAGIRSLLVVPMLKEDEAVGALAIYRREVRPFTDKHIELLTNFAAQAIIAIENTRLLNELRQRTDDLSEALEQQTATSEVLNVISNSLTDTQPVFNAIVRSGLELFANSAITIVLPQGDQVICGAIADASPTRAEALRRRLPIPLSREFMHALAIIDAKVVDIPDVNDPPADLAAGAKNFRPSGFRAVTIVPMMRSGTAIGALSVARAAPGSLTEKQHTMLQTFAAQAVIAIENTRLLKELREFLQQQTATADVLKVISRSAFDLQTVLDTLTASAARLCDADKAFIFRREGAGYRLAANFGFSRDFKEYLERHLIEPGRNSLVGRTTLEGRTIHIPDVLADPEYTWREAVERGGIRTMLGIPLMREGVPIGVFQMTRSAVQPFTDKQIELIESFADQTVIAIENVRLFDEVQKRTEDLSESLQQQTATADVLKVISRSTFDLQAVLNTLTESAAKLCGAEMASMTREEGDAYYYATTYGLSPDIANFLKSTPHKPGRGSVIGRTLTEAKAVMIPDVLADPEYTMAEMQEKAGFRTVLGVPLLREGHPIGVITLQRRTVQPFTGREIELVSTFADQAVIAIENVRLFDEVQSQKREVTQALEHQTATGEVLNVISRSPTNAQPVFDAIVESAARLCEAVFSVVWRYDGDLLHYAASHNFTPEVHNRLLQTYPKRPDRSLAAGRAILDGTIAHVPDLLADPAYGHEFALAGNWRASVAVPMLRDGKAVGAISVGKAEAIPFSERQIQLLTTFADQAVIAIENVRLFDEVQKRTEDLSESLEQQTATSDVLKVISASPGELQPVFDAMLENATRICEAKFGVLWLAEGEGFRPAANLNLPRALTVERQQNEVMKPIPDDPLGQLAATKQMIHIFDARTAMAYKRGFAPFVALVDGGGARTLLVVPLLREDELIGAFAIFRQEVRPFTDKQIELVQNFAAQAVIAIENTRLLNELRESLQQQTATADVLKVISSSPGDLKPVFDAMLDNAIRICDAKFGNLVLADNGIFDIVALRGASTEWAEFQGRRPPFRPGSNNPLARAAATKRVQHIDDARQYQAYLERDASFIPMVELAGARTLLIAPMLKDNHFIGVIAIYRTEVRAFSDKQIELMQNFAAQAVIAIENTRLLKELRESLQQQTATADVLKVISRSTFDLHTVLDTLLHSAARLCDAEQGTITQRKGDAFYRSVAYGYPQAFMEYAKDIPVEVGRDTGTGRALLEGKVIHIHDVTVDPEYTWTQAQQLGGFRTMLGVPMLREGVPVGVLTLTRTEVRPFTDKQIELVTTFADQAAIAIENVRLFESVEARTRELAQSLEDLQTAQDRLVQTQKLASLGQLTAGIAHEIKNPLNFVNNFSSLSTELLDELRDALTRGQFDDKTRADIDDLTETLRGNLDKIEQHGKRADSIVKNMLLHSREGSGEHRPIDINAVVEESLNLAYHGARAEKQDFNITLERSFDPAAGEVDVFPQEITRVLLNLIANGFYAATKRKAQAGNDGYEPALTASTKSLGDRVEIRIRDNGTGIPHEVKEKMFNPFFTTKPPGEGTGLGLSLSYDIVVKQHAGLIEVETEPGTFTEFKIILPRAAATIAKSGGRA